MGRLFQASRDLPLGATDFKLPEHSRNVNKIELLHEYVDVAVCGSHMNKLPLNKQLLDVGATLVKEVKTTPEYSLFDISSSSLKRPGMVRNPSNGASIDVEVWRIPRERAGDFLDNVKAPLTLGNVQLEDGTSVKGFLCESYALSSATDISSFGGWRNYLKSQN